MATTERDKGARKDEDRGPPKFVGVKFINRPITVAGVTVNVINYPTINLEGPVGPVGPVIGNYKYAAAIPPLLPANSTIIVRVTYHGNDPVPRTEMVSLASVAAATYCYVTVEDDGADLTGHAVAGLIP
jgi:hypothetical protein